MGLPTGQTTGLDFTSLDNALKIIYSRQAVVDETFKNRPFHALVSKETDFTGRTYVQDVITSLPQGRSTQFANAQSNKSGLQVDQFNVYRAYDFALASVDMWTLYAAEGDKGSMLDALTSAINGARGSLMRSAAIAEFRNGTGQIGIVSALSGTGANKTVTLTLATDITNFEKSMSVNFWTAANFTAGTATQRTTGAAKSVVQSVDRVNAIVSLDFVPTDPVIVGDIITADGDYVYNSTGTGQGGVTGFGKIAGLDGWLPYGGASSTLFMSLNRTSDLVRLGGWSSNQIGKAEDEALLNASYEEFMFGGGAVDHAFVSPNRFNNIAKQLGPARRFIDVKKGEIGFSALEVMGQGGMIKVLADPNCPDNRGYGLQMDTWKLKTLGPLPRFLNPNAKTLLEPTANRVEVRVGYAGNLVCKAPGYNFVVAFAA